MQNKIVFILRLVVAVVLIQTLRFKFTAHPNSVFIFSELGLEPYGRILIGILELIAGILIVVPKTVWIGAVLSIGLMFGAVMSHITVLGIEVNSDNGTLFATAVTTLLLSSIILYFNRSKIPLKNIFSK